eukprot:CAMPEP_0174368214 /NCGR_PEP_ID=MMETSP0811_2-20130205/88247_1 /TAXON_ID=73025 ORGANISM="Eutreptiella gymnastica-like, Strain CCMP1594" /NCGR_SAMPLE_ID=MMETSP0811_2 /ASSEMBLY_ACC=CAM_ASM_000667 /LENGTH=75 /DNA_ID=CAMNT_0015511497 /DNA_START=182 /DNA_END=406 /DNA_ORIENTATION=-
MALGVLFRRLAADQCSSQQMHRGAAVELDAAEVMSLVSFGVAETAEEFQFAAGYLALGLFQKEEQLDLAAEYWGW